MKNTQPISYLQIDARWKNISYSAKGESTTIGASGCGPTAMAMVLATWADPTVTPKTECAWALAHGYKAPGHGTYHSYVAAAAKRYGLACAQLNSASIYGNAGSGLHAQVLSFLAQGDLIIACMGKGNWTKSGHYVLLWDVQGDVAYVNDPASTLSRRTRGSWSLFKQQVKFYWRIRRPSSVPLPAGEEEAMSTEEIRNLIVETVKVTMKDTIQDAVMGVLSDMGNKPEPDWSVQEGRWEDAKEKGFTDGSRPCSFANRAEVIAMISRVLTAIEEKIDDVKETLEGKASYAEEEIDQIRKTLEDAGMD